MKRPIHPQAIPDEPRAVRWVCDTGTVPVGEVISAPGTVGPLLEYGVISAMLIERAGVWTWLAEGHQWSEHGPRIRDAIVDALTQPGWHTRPSQELLKQVARDVVEVELASYIASHGGQVVVESVCDDVVTINFGGACAHCPAQGSTLHDRIETAIARRYPPVREVVEGTSAGQAKHSGRAFLGIPLPGRGRR